LPVHWFDGHGFVLNHVLVHGVFQPFHGVVLFQPLKPFQFHVEFGFQPNVFVRFQFQPFHEAVPVVLEAVVLEAVVLEAVVLEAVVLEAVVLEAVATAAVAAVEARAVVAVVPGRIRGRPAVRHRVVHV